jgi:hypothetical protein
MSTVFILGLLTAAVAAVRGMWSPCGLSMLTSLNPLAERARGHRYALTAGWYLAGAAAGGALLGAGCALGAAAVGALDPGATPVWSAVAVAAVVALVSDSPVLPARLPVHPRQVDVRWLTAYRRWLYAAGFGVQIGSGFATYIMTAATYLTAALAVLTGSPAQAFLVGLTFGVVRGLGIFVTVAVRTPAQLRGVAALVDRLTAASLIAAMTASAVVAVVAAWELGGAVAAAVTAPAAAALAVARPVRAGRRNEPVRAEATAPAGSAAARAGLG